MQASRSAHRCCPSASKAAAVSATCPMAAPCVTTQQHFVRPRCGIATTATAAATSSGSCCASRMMGGGPALPLAPMRRALQGRAPRAPAPAAAAAAAGAVAAASSGLQGAAAIAAAVTSPGAIFSATSALMVPIYTLMVLLPRAKVTRTLVSSPLLPLGMSLLYIFLLGQAMAGGLVESIVGIITALKPPAFIPDVTALATLFSSPVVTNLAWVHLLLLDFYQARAVLVDGIECSVPTGHSIILCFLFGPLGLLSHFITRAIHTVMAGTRQPASSLL